MYRAYAFVTDIAEVEVARMTEKKVYFPDGRSSLRRNDATGIGFFATWEEAKQFMLEFVDSKLRDIQADVATYNADRDKILMLEKPRC